MELATDYRNEPMARTGRPWRKASQPSSGGRHRAQRLCRLAAITTAAAFAIPFGELNASTRRTPYVAFARQSAMYLSHVSFGLSYSEVGRAFGRDRTTAAYACRLVEDRRDDPAVDAVLGSLENACGGLLRRLGHGFGHALAAPVQP